MGRGADFRDASSLASPGATAFPASRGGTVSEDDMMCSDGPGTPVAPSTSAPSPAALYNVRTSLGTTGFDVVGSWGWLRVEVPEASLNPGNNTSADSITSSSSPPSTN